MNEKASEFLKIVNAIPGWAWSGAEPNAKRNGALLPWATQLALDMADARHQIGGRESVAKAFELCRWDLVKLFSVVASSPVSTTQIDGQPIWREGAKAAGYSEAQADLLGNWVTRLLDTCALQAMFSHPNLVALAPSESLVQDLLGHVAPQELFASWFANPHPIYLDLYQSPIETTLEGLMVRVVALSPAHEKPGEFVLTMIVYEDGERIQGFGSRHITSVTTRAVFDEIVGLSDAAIDAKDAVTEGGCQVRQVRDLLSLALMCAQIYSEAPRDYTTLPMLERIGTTKNPRKAKARAAEASPVRLVSLAPRTRYEGAALAPGEDLKLARKMGLHRVRAHPRMQAYGKGHSLRRLIFVKAFMKGSGEPTGAALTITKI